MNTFWSALLFAIILVVMVAWIAVVTRPYWSWML
jgi:hypothetical protein